MGALVIQCRGFVVDGERSVQPLVIFGAGGLGRELYGWITSASPGFRQQWQVTAFVADDAQPNATIAKLPVLRRRHFRDRLRVIFWLWPAPLTAGVLPPSLRR